MIYLKEPLKLEGLDIDKVLLGSNKDLIKKTSRIQGEIDTFNSKALSDAIRYIREIDSIIINISSNLFLFCYSELAKDSLDLMVDPPNSRIPSNIHVGGKINDSSDLIILSSSIGAWLISDKKKSTFTIRHHNNIHIGKILLDNYSEVLSKNLNKNWEDFKKASNSFQDNWKHEYEQHLEYLLKWIKDSKRLPSTNFNVEKIKELMDVVKNFGSMGDQVSKLKEVRKKLIFDIFNLLNDSEKTISNFVEDDILNSFLLKKEEN